jgi:hypothetical protein
MGPKSYLRSTSNSNLVIIPSRERPSSVVRAVNALKHHSAISDICVGLDSDDHVNYPRIPGVIYEVDKRRGVNGTLNKIATKYSQFYQTISFIGDDNLVRTDNWDLKLSEPLQIKSFGISYGNDLLRVDRLPTTVMMTSNLINILGFMAPKKIKHMYIDNFWQELGNSLEAIFYFEDVIVEHLHFSNGKSNMDNLYKQTNSMKRFKQDHKNFQKYMVKKFKKDVDKIKSNLYL